MSESGVRNKYHIAIAGKGYMIYGSPSSPAYVKEEAPTLVNQLGLGDLSYNQLNGSGWSHWAQTDWSGGFQRLKWKDDASFKNGQAIDTIKKYGEIKIQNSFTSAASISGSQGYNAHSIHDNKLLIGTVKSGGAKLISITSAGTMATISAMTGISAVNSISRFAGDTLVGMTRTSGSIKTLAKYNGTSLSGFRNTNSIVRAVRGIGIRAYISEYVAAASGDTLSYATNLSAFTSAYNAGKGRKITTITDLVGFPYFFVEEVGGRVEFRKWDEFSEKDYLIYTWDNLTNYGVTNYVSIIVITGTSNGKKVAFAFNGARLWQIFDDQLLDSSYDFSKPFEFEGNLQVKGATWDGQYWFPGIYGKFANVQYTPFCNFANRAYGYAVTGTTTKIGYRDPSKYNLSGYVNSSEFGSSVAGVDKLINSVSINCEPLTTGQTIEVFYTKNNGSSYISAGKMSYTQDGAASKKQIYLPSGVVTKLWEYKTTLVGPGTSTPTVKDIDFEYRPFPDTKKRWSMTINARDDVNLLNRQQDERDSKNMVSQLWMERDSKRTVVFEDLNSFNTTLVSGITSASTSAIVNSTRFMPPKGRARFLVSGVVEEINYLSANGNTIKGISRAQKGTVARSYISGAQLDNFRTVLVTSVREQIVNTDQNNTESVASVELLEV